MINFTSMLYVSKIVNETYNTLVSLRRFFYSICYKMSDQNQDMSKSSKKAALIILDGWGINPDPKVSAIEAANTPYFDYLISAFPNSTLTTFGEEVGLPEGQMGNSEVGHMNIGAGRVVFQELVRINKAIKEGEVRDNPVFKEAIQKAVEGNKKLHLLGLLSDGGVHSHIQHLIGLCQILKNYPDMEVYIHAFMDGRDTDPQMGALYIRQIEDLTRGSNVHIASVIGRYYAMDRDNRWERTRLAYELLVNGAGTPVNDFADSVKDQYSKGVTDEFMVALKSQNFDQNNMNLRDGDVVVFFNFRTDRPRQLTQVLTQSDMHEYNMHALQLHLVTFTDYDKTFRNVNVLFEKDNLDNTLGQVLSENGKTQVRITETEKYPHVTFFFNGGREQPYPGESRIMIPSPKVATYDLKPEMSAYEITEAIIQFVKNNHPDFICLNYANTDMVGHTGDFKAAVKAAETVDACLSKLIPVLMENDYCNFIIADHGNSDVMVNEDGSPNTAHTTNPVPVIVVSAHPFSKVNSGKLGDIAPTILSVMDLTAPAVMKGNLLIS